MNDTEKLEIDGILEKEGISSSDLERFFKSRRTSGELGDDELDAVSGGDVLEVTAIRARSVVSH